MAVKTFDCLRRIGFRDNGLGLEIDTSTFHCTVANDGMLLPFMVWQANEGQFGDRNTWMMPRETRIWPEFETWEQFEAGFSFLITQCQYRDFASVCKLVPPEILDVLVDGARHFHEFEPIGKFLPARDVTDADFAEIEEYVSREDSTTHGYYELTNRIQAETYWSVGGFKGARRIDYRQEESWKDVLRKHDRRFAREEFEAGMPYKFVFKLFTGRVDKEETWEIDLVKKTVLYVKPENGRKLVCRLKCGRQPKKITAETDAEVEITAIVDLLAWNDIETAFETADFSSLGSYYRGAPKLAVRAPIELKIKKGNKVVRRIGNPDALYEHEVSSLLSLRDACAQHFDVFMKLDRCFGGER